MSKSDDVRKILGSHQTVFTNQVAVQVSCTQPLVFQVIRSMEIEGESFDKRQVGRFMSYRLLTSAEAAERLARRRKVAARIQRNREIGRLRDELTCVRATIESALIRLDTLAS